MSDPRAEWIGWALDVLRRYAPDPVVDRDDAQDLDEEIAAIESLDYEQFGEKQQGYHGGDRR